MTRLEEEEEEVKMERSAASDSGRVEEGRVLPGLIPAWLQSQQDEVK